MSKKEAKAKKSSFRSIANTLSMKMGAIILVIMAAAVVTVVLFSGNLIKAGIDRDLQDIAQKNAVKVQAVTDAAEIASSNIAAGVSYYSSRSGGDARSEVSAKNSSIAMTPWQKEEETFLNVAMISAMTSHPEYEGMGILFKEGGFQPGFEDAYGYYMAPFEDKFMTILQGANASRPEVLKALETGEIQYTDPHRGRFTKNTNITGAYPIKFQGATVGVVFIDMNVNAFEAIREGSENYETMLVDVIEPTHKMAFSSFESDIGKGFGDFLGEATENAIIAKMDQGEQFAMETVNGKWHKVRAFTPVHVGGERWWTQTSIDYKEYSASLRMMVIVFAIGVVIAVLALYLFSRSLFKKTLAPLPGAAKMAELVAVGNFNEIKELTAEGIYEKDDEIGLLMKSLNAMTVRMENIMSDIKEKLGKMGDGDFSFQNDQTDVYVGAYSDILTNLDTIESKLNTTISEIRDSSDMINTSASQVSAGAQALAQGSTEQASSIEELSTTMTGITTKIQETNSKTEEAAEIGRSANEAVQLSNEKMEKLSDAMKDITNKADEIAKIITTIDDIAFQTNILALNASIEAARAGQAGKGFAVVADEVGNLASKSAKSAQSIAGLIQETIEAVNNGAELTTDTANALKEVEENTVKIGTLMHEIADASAEQAKGVSDVSTGIDQISAVVQTNSATAEESAAASQQLSDEADSMFGLVKGFVLKSEEEAPASNDDDEIKAAPVVTAPAVSAPEAPKTGHSVRRPAVTRPAFAKPVEEEMNLTFTDDKY